MSRQYIDCREYPSTMNCSVALSADNSKELLEAAVQHAVTVHGHTDSPELRKQLGHDVQDRHAARGTARIPGRLNPGGLGGADSARFSASPNPFPGTFALTSAPSDGLPQAAQSRQFASRTGAVTVGSISAAC